MNLAKLNIILHWINFSLALIAGAFIYSFFVGPLPTGVWIGIGLVIPASSVPIIYLSLNSDYVASACTGGSFGETRLLNKAYIEIDEKPNLRIYIAGMKFTQIHLNRWGIFSRDDYPITLYYDRLTKKWYYHYYNPKSEQIVETLKKAVTRL